MNNTIPADSLITSMGQLHGYVIDFKKYYEEEILPSSDANGLANLDQEKKTAVARRLNYVLSNMLIIQDAMAIVAKEPLSDDANHTIASLDSSIQHELLMLRRAMILSACTNQVIH